jgi:hypothetical protein
MNVQWVRIRSWHAVRYQSLSLYLTLCGRYSDQAPVDDLPGGKTCESCLRIIAKQADKPTLNTRGTAP